MWSPDTSVNRPGAEDPELVWAALLSAARWRRGEESPEEGGVYGVDATGQLCPVSPGDPRALMAWRGSTGWVRSSHAPSAARALLDLYLPMCNTSSRSQLIVAHLGQGLDGYIATGSGDSNYVTGPENILHLHRMRALCDAVMVGAETVASDDPQLTNRRVQGHNPVRIILDPRRRLPRTRRVFSDRKASTLLVCDEARVSKGSERVGQADVLGIPLEAGRLDLERLLEALHARDLISVFIEGGGDTVSAFLNAGLLDRLQIAVAPLVTGAGRPGLRLPAREHMKDCLRPPHYRIFNMGGDVLFDCDLRYDTRAVDAERRAAGLSRIL